MARLNYILGDFNEAMSTQQRAVMMSERLYGVDHAQVISEYTHLALYAFANGHIQNSLRYLYRARYLLLVLNGEDHPEMSLIDSNLGIALQGAGDYENAAKFLEKAVELNKKYFGPKSTKTALAYHLLARLQSFRGDFRTALSNERETFQIYRDLLGEDHMRTNESAQVLRHFTQQAVLLQRRLNEIQKGEKACTYTPIQIEQPSMQSLLQLLNGINGIIYLPSKEDDIEKIREELSKLQTLTDGKKQQEQEVNNNTTNAVPMLNSQDDDLQ
jgi:protein TIF31